MFLSSNACFWDIGVIDGNVTKRRRQLLRILRVIMGLKWRWFLPLRCEVYMWRILHRVKPLPCVCAAPHDDKGEWKFKVKRGLRQPRGLRRICSQTSAWKAPSHLIFSGPNLRKIHTASHGVGLKQECCVI